MYAPGGAGGTVVSGSSRLDITLQFQRRAGGEGWLGVEIEAVDGVSLLHCCTEPAEL